MATEEELRTQHLDVYDTRAGPWNPDHGDIEIPEDWELLPTGDAFVTRTVKAASCTPPPTRSVGALPMLMECGPPISFRSQSLSVPVEADVASYRRR